MSVRLWNVFGAPVAAAFKETAPAIRHNVFLHVLGPFVALKWWDPSKGPPAFQHPSTSPPIPGPPGQGRARRHRSTAPAPCMCTATRACSQHGCRDRSCYTQGRRLQDPLTASPPAQCGRQARPARSTGTCHPSYRSGPAWPVWSRWCSSCAPAARPNASAPPAG